MFRKGMKLVGPLALAALLFGSAPAAAAGPRSAGGVLDWAWHWLQALWTEKAPVPLWEEAGPCIDPNGRPCAGTTGDAGQAAGLVPLWEEAGPCVDPDGRPCAGTAGDAGQAEPSTDNGPLIDPNG